MLLSYKKQLLLLQIELVKLQRHFIQCDNKILVIIEGRDAAGKDGLIKRIAEHLSPRETRIVALGNPPTKKDPPGTSSALSPICPAPVSSYCLTAAGTTGPV